MNTIESFITINRSNRINCNGMHASGNGGRTDVYGPGRRAINILSSPGLMLAAAGREAAPLS